jgi:large subunit ribosomal protein L25
MAKTISLKANVRSQLGRNALKAVRLQGRIPAVVYGKKGSQAIDINRKELAEALHQAHSENVLVDLKLSNGTSEETKLAFLQDVQRDFLKDCVVHVDLHEISPDEKLHAEVPVVEFGEAEGVRTSGGLLEVQLRKLRIECLPKDLPEEIVVDVTSLNIGESIHVRDLVVPEGVHVLNAKDQSVVAVFAPKKEEEVAATAADGAKQPEVLKEKKQDGAAAPAAKAGAPKAAAAKSAKK